MADDDDSGIHLALADTAQQITEDVTTRYRAAAIAHRQGQQVEQRTLNSRSTEGAAEAKRPLNLAPKGIPMSLILSADPEEGAVIFLRLCRSMHEDLCVCTRSVSNGEVVGGQRGGEGQENSSLVRYPFVEN